MEKIIFLNLFLFILFNFTLHYGLEATKLSNEKVVNEQLDDLSNKFQLLQTNNKRTTATDDLIQKRLLDIKNGLKLWLSNGDSVLNEHFFYNFNSRCEEGFQLMWDELWNRQKLIAKEQGYAKDHDHMRVISNNLNYEFLNERKEMLKSFNIVPKSDSSDLQDEKIRNYYAANPTAGLLLDILVVNSLLYRHTDEGYLCQIFNRENAINKEIEEIGPAHGDNRIHYSNRVRANWRNKIGDGDGSDVPGPSNYVTLKEQSNNRCAECIDCFCSSKSCPPTSHHHTRTDCFIFTNANDSANIDCSCCCNAECINCIGNGIAESSHCILHAILMAFEGIGNAICMEAECMVTGLELCGKCLCAELNCIEHVCKCILSEELNLLGHLCNCLIGICQAALSGGNN